MIRVFMQLFYFIYERFCFGFGFYMSGVPDKYRVFELFLSLSGTFQGLVVIQSSASIFLI
ncbi:hypothetical protein MmTuc01_2017 [Methanosarcina mazei Tuc01]|uniref:Uncharacterized protein n=1 Tax=Methanosarcina mazei Tuc01 TaxID=1236903 RepID=M1QK56_METMZ|nr:hypothetical protein MmTuc01_2017 [Methanosarcina mazei Tuc01]